MRDRLGEIAHNSSLEMEDISEALETMERALNLKGHIKKRGTTTFIMLEIACKQCYVGFVKRQLNRNTHILRDPSQIAELMTHTITSEAQRKT
jgi:hypothetical protein